MNEIVFTGCTPTPLANYLKALGVLRLLAAKHPETWGFWHGDRFVLRTSLNEQDVMDFFLNDYAPTPIMAPWNSGSGFYYQERKSKEMDVTGKKKKLGIFDQETTASKAVDAMLNSRSKRLAAYREALGLAKTLVSQAGLVASPAIGRQKDDFILSLRALLPDKCLDAMDAGLAVTVEKTQYPPLLGTGWNDGNLDFTSNFMQRLLDVLGTTDATPPGQSHDWLHSCLFSTCSPNLTKSSIGQFSPGHAGGPNASIGYEGDARINPWDFVLMIEGALMFAVSALRRNADDSPVSLDYPFTVRAVGAGSGSLGVGDAANARGELWMPLWQKPASCAELRAMMAEGRVALGRRPARDALDFVRAVHQLGGYPGVRSYQRFGLLMRLGKSYLATPLSRVEVGDEPQSSPLNELDNRNWLEQFRLFTRGDNIANRFPVLCRQLEDRLFDLSGREPTPVEMQSLLILLGEIQQAMTASSKARESLNPVPRLSERWVTAADDGSPEFRIAKALAGLHGMGDEPLPLRAQLFPVHRKYAEWMTPEAGEKARICVGQRARLVDTLRVLLERRLWLAETLKMEDKPLASSAGAMLEDINVFLRNDHMDARIKALLPGLSLCKIPEDTDRIADEGTLPAAFALMKLALTPDRTLLNLGLLNDAMRMPKDMVAQLAAGNHDNRAVKIAWRCLRASRLAPFFAGTIPALAGIKTSRAAAALLIPLRWEATATLARTLLEEPETKAGPAVNFKF